MIERSISLLKFPAKKLGQIQLPEAANVVILVLVEVAEALAMTVNLGEHIHHIVLGLKTEHGPRLLPGDLVVPEVLKVLDFDRELLAGEFLDPFLDHVADGADGVVIGDQVEDAIDARVRLDGPEITPDRVADIEKRPPNRGV